MSPVTASRATIEYVCTGRNGSDPTGTDKAHAIVIRTEIARIRTTGPNICFLPYKACHDSWFPRGGGFRISPGLIFGNGNEATLSSTTPGGQRTDIGDTEYLSNPANPIKSTGSVTVKSTGLAITMGWGNIVGRARRWSVPFEIGVVFQGTPVGALAFTGSGCNTNGTNCRDVATDAGVQAEVRKQNTELNDNLNRPIAKYFPILTIGFGIRF